ncbi:MAG: HPP family protein [Methylocystis sp.]|nr:MAG: HPP family protein [Methylocystis sp.]
MSTFRSVSQAAAPALIGGAVIGLVGALALFFRQPWLIPSLGPTIFLQLVNAADPAARPRAILLGHAIGVAAGFGALFLCGAQGAPPVFGEQILSPGRLVATALAVGATIFVQTLAGAKHPPAAATTMLITLGGVKPAWGAVLAIAAGVALAAAAAHVGAQLLQPGAGVRLGRKKAASVRGHLAKRASPERPARKREPAEA